jgi:hypothetical protein
MTPQPGVVAGPLTAALGATIYLQIYCTKQGERGYWIYIWLVALEVVWSRKWLFLLTRNSYVGVSTKISIIMRNYGVIKPSYA